MRETSNGVVTELSGSNTTNRRSLFAGRQLSTTVEYNVYNADSVEIVYRNRADVNIPSNTGGGSNNTGRCPNNPGGGSNNTGGVSNNTGEVSNTTGGSSNIEGGLSAGVITVIVMVVLLS